MKADAKTENAVRDVLNGMAESYAKRDLKGLLSLIAPDADVVMYGTGADEKRIGQEQIKIQAQRDWSQTESSALDYDWISVSANGNIAWAAADATFKIKAGSESMNLPARLTSVLEKRNDRWLIVQAHFSLPASGQAEGESFPA